MIFKNDRQGKRITGVKTADSFLMVIVLLVVLTTTQQHYNVSLGVTSVLGFLAPTAKRMTEVSTSSFMQCDGCIKFKNDSTVSLTSRHHSHQILHQCAQKVHKNMETNEQLQPSNCLNQYINNIWMGVTKNILSFIFVFVVSMMSSAVPVLATMDNTMSSPTIVQTSSTTTTTIRGSPSTEKRNDNRYYSIQTYGTEEERIQSNLKLLDYIIGSINTMYYDVTAGTNFDPRNFYIMSQQYIHDRTIQNPKLLSTRDGVVSIIHGLLNDILQDPYSSYLTREELRAELQSSSSSSSSSSVHEQTVDQRYQQELGIIVKEANLDANKFLFGPTFNIPSMTLADGLSSSFLSHNLQQYSSSSLHLSPLEGYRLPVIVAVSPNSLGERLGLTVGDRIITPIWSHNSRVPSTTTGSSNSNPETINNSEISFVTVAKPIYDVSFVKTDSNDDGVNDLNQSLISTRMNENSDSTATNMFSTNGSSSADSNSRIRGYRPIRVRIPTTANIDENDVSLDTKPNTGVSSTKSGGNAYVHYEVLSSTNSIFQKNYPVRNGCLDPSRCNNDVGYIRLTRFSRASTKGFMDAVQTLEGLGIRRYIIDVRNNYGGVIQEAMLCAATLLRDPHMVLCYTMNSRGGLTPHDVEEYVMDTRYPGYWLSRESHDTTRLQVQREHPSWFRSSSTDEWLPMSSFASLHEQHVKRGIKLTTTSNNRSTNFLPLKELQQLAAQKDIVLLINEGTASSAEVFASSLHDNGRTVALVGTKTYGKGLVQHTFPTPDGGGLRLTVVEYLTPALHHVTHVGGAQYDRQTGAYIGGGIQPDIVCDSIHGIPSNVGSDLCVGVGIDALNEADHAYQSTGQLSVKRVGGIDDGSRARRAVTIGILRDDF